MKIIKKFKEKDLDILLFIILIVSIPAFLKNLSADDELWNFAYIYKMNLGFIPYKDLNIIVTPLFHLLGLIVLKLFGMNFLGFHIYNLLIFTTLLFLVFKIFKNLNVNKRNAVLYTLLSYMFIRSLIGGRGQLQCTSYYTNASKHIITD